MNVPSGFTKEYLLKRAIDQGKPAEFVDRIRAMSEAEIAQLGQELAAQRAAAAKRMAAEMMRKSR